MNLDRLSEGAKQHLGAAHDMALAGGHAEVEPEHVLLAMLRDDASGLRSALVSNGVDVDVVEEALGRGPRRQAGRSGVRPPSAAPGGAGEDRMGSGPGPAIAAGRAARPAQSDPRRGLRLWSEGVPLDRRGHSGGAGARRHGPEQRRFEQPKRGAQPAEVQPLPHRPGPRWGPGPGCRAAPRNPQGHAGPLSPRQEQPGADRQARRRQDGDRRGAGPAHRARRRPRVDREQVHLRPRPGRRGRRDGGPQRLRRQAAHLPQRGARGQRRLCSVRRRCPGHRP